MVKLHPFWWLKALRHPSYVCWYDSCEDCSVWTLNPHHTCSVDAVDFMEYQASIGIYGPDLALPEDGYNSYAPFTDCDRYRAFWAKAPLMSPPPMYGSLAYAMFWKDALNFLGWRFSYDGVNYTLGPIASVEGVGYGGSLEPYNPSAWDWLEIRSYVGVSEFSRNGVVKWTWTRGIEKNNLTQFRIKQPNSFYMGLIKLDYIRASDRWEFPPT